MSPLIVRTVEVPAGRTLSDLHAVLLVCFGWSGESLYRFEIRGRCYSDSRFVDADSARVPLGALGLRTGERFCWHYNFRAGWVVDVRVEAVLDEVDNVSLDDGRRAGPPEWCGGPDGFADWEDSHSVFEFVEAIAAVADVDSGSRPGDLSEAELMGWLREVAEWMVRDRFDKAGVNRRLSTLEIRSCVSLSRSE